MNMNSHEKKMLKYAGLCAIGYFFSRVSFSAIIGYLSILAVIWLCRRINENKKRQRAYEIKTGGSKQYGGIVERRENRKLICNWFDWEYATNPNFPFDRWEWSNDSTTELIILHRKEHLHIEAKVYFTGKGYKKAVKSVKVTENKYQRIFPEFIVKPSNKLGVEEWEKYFTTWSNKEEVFKIINNLKLQAEEHPVKVNYLTLTSRKRSNITEDEIQGFKTVLKKEFGFTDIIFQNFKNVLLVAKANNNEVKVYDLPPDQIPF